MSSLLFMDLSISLPVITHFSSSTDTKAVMISSRMFSSSFSSDDFSLDNYGTSIKISGLP
jgi:hypothetical protein